MAGLTGKTNIKIQKYRDCPIRFNGDDRIIEYIEDNRELLKAVLNAFSTEIIISAT